MSDIAASDANRAPETLRNQVRSAVIWRSGTQILGQMIAWGSTFVVIRILDPRDYGLFAMTQVILVLLNMLNGYGLASALIREADAGRSAQRQLFGMLVLLNFTLGAIQFLAAPFAASYYRQPDVASLLRVQALLYVFTPFMALPYALLSREMEFRKQAQVTLLSSVAGALAALTGAYMGIGVWTLVLAPIVLFATRAVGLTIAANSLMWPSFDFRGSGRLARFGGLMAAGQLFWFLQSQADVFIAGRMFSPHMLGIYTTSLFLTQIFVSKFVPPLNEVAFSAYARIQDDRAAVAAAFAKSARIIMVVAMPFYLGLAAAAEPVVLVALGEKWREAIPIVHLLSFAMPFMTMLVLFPPATDAMGRPELSMRNGALGAIILPAGFLAGVHWDASGMAIAWIVAYPLYLAAVMWKSLPIIGLSLRALAEAIAPPIVAALAMAIAVGIVDHALPPLTPLMHLAVLTGIGGATYGGWLILFARDTMREVTELVRKRG